MDEKNKTMSNFSELDAMERKGYFFEKNMTKGKSQHQIFQHPFSRCNWVLFSPREKDI